MKPTYTVAQQVRKSLVLSISPTRLNLGPERLQVICTSASFRNPDYAEEFGAQLSGKEEDFIAVKGDLLSRSPSGAGSQKDAVALATVDLNAFDGSGRRRPARVRPATPRIPFADCGCADLPSTLYEALRNFGPG